MCPFQGPIPSHWWDFDLGQAEYLELKPKYSAWQFKALSPDCSELLVVTFPMGRISRVPIQSRILGHTERQSGEWNPRQTPVFWKVSPCWMSTDTDSHHHAFSLTDSPAMPCLIPPSPVFFATSPREYPRLLIQKHALRPLSSSWTYFALFPLRRG